MSIGSMGDSGTRAAPRRAWAGGRGRQEKSQGPDPLYLYLYILK